MKLLLFFTYKVSLNDWLSSGIFSREVLLYKKLSDQGVDVTFITYDSEDRNHELNKYGIKHIALYSNKNKKINNSILFSSIKFLIKNKKIIKDSDFKDKSAVWFLVGLVNKAGLQKTFVYQNRF